MSLFGYLLIALVADEILSQITGMPPLRKGKW